MNAKTFSWKDIISDGNVSISMEETLCTYEDPIALSCVMYRLRTTNESIDNRPSYLFNLKSDAKILAKSITIEDRLLAQTIRSFYNGKLIVARLRNQTLTQFRQDLATLLLLNANEYGLYNVPEKFAGMLYKIPYFYEYDRTLIDDVFGSEYASIHGPNKKQFAKLEFIRKLDAYRKRNPRFEYWFMDENMNRVVLYIDKSNPIEPLFEKHVSENNVYVNGSFVTKRIDNLNFYTPYSNWTIEV
jgi:hypothetical protein